MMNWNGSFNKVQQYVVKIRTPTGHGTGFVFAYNGPGNLVAIATAAHVVDDANEWRQPIRIKPDSAGDAVYLEHKERVIWTDQRSDSAILLVPRDAFAFPDEVLPQVPKDKFRGVGSPVGWMGYPSVAPSSLCFFRGYTSAFVDDGDYYLIDGVAINGVSGGPVFDSVDNPTVLGIVCAYYANRQRDQVLPGLLMAQDLTYMHTIIEGIRNLDQAREKQASEKQKSKEEGESTARNPEATPS